jgi:hypothetical protein
MRSQMRRDHGGSPKIPINAEGGGIAELYDRYRIDRSLERDRALCAERALLCRMTGCPVSIPVANEHGAAGTGVEVVEAVERFQRKRLLEGRERRRLGVLWGPDTGSQFRPAWGLKCVYQACCDACCSLPRLA